MEGEAVALLPLDKGSVLVPRRMGIEISLKHVDGTIHRAIGGSDGFKHQRRHEYDLEWAENGGSPGFAMGLATLADKQAFGLRVDGYPTNFSGVSKQAEPADTVEIEPLDRGGIVLQTPRQLPIAVYTTEGETYLLDTGEVEIDSGSAEESNARLLRRHGSEGEWELLAWANPLEVRYLVERLAENTGMKTVSSPGREDIKAAIEDAELSFFEATRTEEEDEIAERMALQARTAFPPNAPAPRPISGVPVTIEPADDGAQPE